MVFQRDDDVYDQSERSELIFLSFVISLAEFAPLSVEDSSRQFMTIFAFVKLLEYTTTFGFVVDVVERMNCFVDAAQALEEIEPVDKTRIEVLYARVDIYLGARKWDMPAAVASHLVKADLGNPAAWINFAYAVRRAQNIQAAEAILLKARALHPKKRRRHVSARNSRIPAGRLVS